MTKYPTSITLSKKWLWLLWLTFLVVRLNAQTPGRFDFPDQPNLNYFKSYVPVSMAVVSSPAHWKKNQWIVAGSVATAGPKKPKYRTDECFQVRVGAMGKWRISCSSDGQFLCVWPCCPGCHSTAGCSWGHTSVGDERHYCTGNQTPNPSTSSISGYPLQSTFVGRSFSWV